MLKLIKWNILMKVWAFGVIFCLNMECMAQPRFQNHQFSLQRSSGHMSRSRSPLMTSHRFTSQRNLPIRIQRPSLSEVVAPTFQRSRIPVSGRNQMNFNDLPSPIRTSFDTRFVSPYQTSSHQRNAQSRGQAIPARVTSRNTAHPTILRIPLRMPEPSQLPLRPRGMTSGIPRPIPRQGTMARHMKPVANKVLEVTSPRNQLSKRMRFPGPFALHRLPKQPVQEQISRRKQIAIPVKVPISQTVPLSQQNTIQTKSQLPTPIIDSQAKSDVLSLGMANNEFNVKLNILNGAEHTVLNDRTAFSNHGVTHLNIEPLLTDNGAIVLNKEVMHHNNIHVPALPGSAATVSNNSVDTFNIGGQHSNNGGTFSNTGAIHSNIGASPLTNNIQITKLSPGNDPLFDELVNEFTKALQDSTSLNTHTHAHNGHANTHAHQPLTPTQHLANFHPQTAFAHMQFGGPFGVNPWFMDPAARQEMLFGDTTDPPHPRHNLPLQQQPQRPLFQSLSLLMSMLLK